MSLGWINDSSVKSKVPEIVNYIVEQKLDVTAITEPWLGAEGHDQVTEGNLCPPVIVIVPPRSQGRGGGSESYH